MEEVAEPQRIGHLRLNRGEVLPPLQGVVDLELASAGALVDEWLRAGGMLALQAIAPAAALPQPVRSRMSFLGVGPGAALAAYAALRLGAQRAEVVLHPDEQDAFDRLARTAAEPERAASYRRIEDVPNGAFHDMTAYGCDGAVPSLDLCAPLVRRLRPEGQLLLYGFPADALDRMFDEVASRGLSLRAMGIAGGLGFLAGSLERSDFR